MGRGHNSGHWTVDMRSLTPETADRYRRVLELRVAGHTFDNIATMVGYQGRQSAKKAYDAALERWAIESVQQQRIIQNERLDALWRVAFGAVQKGRLNLIDTCLKIEKRRADLWGLDGHPSAEPKDVEKEDVGKILKERLDALHKRYVKETDNESR